MDISPCLVCGGRGRVRCQFCGGRGTVGDSAAAGAPAPRRRQPDADVLAGRWNAAQGGSYEFVKQGGGYRLTEYGPIGQTGTGTATLSGHTVTLDVNNVVLGRYTVRLQLGGDTLQGQLNVMGMPMPLVLTRG
jgi:hypothetical protein